MTRSKVLKFLTSLVALCALQCGGDEGAQVEVIPIPTDPVVIESPMTLKRNGEDLTVTPPWIRWRWAVRNHTDRDVVIVNMSLVSTSAGGGAQAARSTLSIDPGSQLQTLAGTSCPPSGAAGGSRDPSCVSRCRNDCSGGGDPNCSRRCEQGCPILRGSNAEGSGNPRGEDRQVLAVVGPNTIRLGGGGDCDGEFVELTPYYLSNIGQAMGQNANPDSRRVFFIEGFLTGWFEGPARDPIGGPSWLEGQYEACEARPYSQLCNTPELVNGALNGSQPIEAPIRDSRVIPTRRMTARFRFSTQ